VRDLVSAYGPDVTQLCQASAALVPGVAGMGLLAAGSWRQRWPWFTTFTAAAAELLTLERHGLRLTSVFARGWRARRPANAADATGADTPAAPPQATDRVLLACWFGLTVLSPLREQIRALATGQGLRDDQRPRPWHPCARLSPDPSAGPGCRSSDGPVPASTSPPTPAAPACC
jgi:hypothetical protein